MRSLGWLTPLTSRVRPSSLTSSAPPRQTLSWSDTKTQRSRNSFPVYCGAYHSRNSFPVCDFQRNSSLVCHSMYCQVDFPPSYLQYFVLGYTNPCQYPVPPRNSFLVVPHAYRWVCFLLHILPYLGLDQGPRHCGLSSYGRVVLRYLVANHLSKLLVSRYLVAEHLSYRLSLLFFYFTQSPSRHRVSRHKFPSVNKTK